MKRKPRLRAGFSREGTFAARGVRFHLTKMEKTSKVGSRSETFCNFPVPTASIPTKKDCAEREHAFTVVFYGLVNFCCKTVQLDANEPGQPNRFFIGEITLRT